MAGGLQPGPTGPYRDRDRMARKSRTAVLKRQREAKKAEKAAMKREKRMERDASRGEGGAQVATVDDLAGYGFADDAEPEDNESTG